MTFSQIFSAPEFGDRFDGQSPLPGAGSTMRMFFVKAMKLPNGKLRRRAAPAVLDLRGSRNRESATIRSAKFRSYEQGKRVRSAALLVDRIRLRYASAAAYKCVAQMSVGNDMNAY